MKKKILGLLLLLSLTGTLAFALDNGDTTWQFYGTNIKNVNSGNVGIGSATPGKALDVTGSIRASGQYFGDGSQLTGITTFSAAGTGSEIQARSTGSTVQAVTGSATSGGNVGIGTTLTSNKVTNGGNESIGSIYAGVAAPTNGLIVQGNVGVASTNPGQLLDVQGSARASTSVISPIHIGGSAATSSNTIQSTSGTGTTDTIVFKVGNNGGTTAATIISSGNVGISTTNPGASLDIGSTMRLNGNVFYFDSVNKDSLFDTGGASPKIQFNMNSAAVMYLNTAGNLGIGSAAPGTTLDVNGSIRSIAGGSAGENACWCTTPPKVLGYCTGALGTCSACNYNGSGC